MSGEVPEGRCGFTLEHEDVDRVDSDDYGTDDEWFRAVRGCCCWRKTWRDHERCIWHADVARKPTDELAAARAETAERLDGAHLRGVDLKDAVPFAECGLTGADLIDATLPWADLAGACLQYADLSDANLIRANLTSADLQYADLSSADLFLATLSDVDFCQADLTGANLGSTHLINACLRDADLPDAILSAADLTDADLNAATLTGADLEAAKLTDADLMWTDLTDADFGGGDLTDADLPKADLANKDLRDANFDGANLEEADCSGADLRYTSFENAFLHETYLDDARINADTDLRPVHAYDLPGLQAAEADTFWDRLRLNLQTARHYLTPSRWRNTDTDPERSVRIHRKLQQLHRESAMPGEVPHHYVREKHARRRRMRVEGNPISWLTLAGARWTTLYGESPWRVIYTSLVVIGAGVLIYPHTGLDGHSLFDRLYFSVATFTPLMQAEGLPAPTTQATKAVAMVQALLGVALTALLVAVLDRRITR